MSDITGRSLPFKMKMQIRQIALPRFAALNRRRKKNSHFIQLQMKNRMLHGLELRLAAESARADASEAVMARTAQRVALMLEIADTMQADLDAERARVERAEAALREMGKHPEECNDESGACVSHLAYEDCKAELEALKSRLGIAGYYKPERYRHYKGDIYTYITDATLEWCPDDENAHVIIYIGEDGRRWVRPRNEFFGLLPDGRPRFTKIEEPSE